MEMVVMGENLTSKLYLNLPHKKTPQLAVFFIWDNFIFFWEPLYAHLSFLESIQVMILSTNKE